MKGGFHGENKVLRSNLSLTESVGPESLLTLAAFEACVMAPFGAWGLAQGGFIDARKNARRRLPRSPKREYSWAFRYCGPPPPRQAAGDSARARRGPIFRKNINFQSPRPNEKSALGITFQRHGARKFSGDVFRLRFGVAVPPRFKHMAFVNLH